MKIFNKSMSKKGNAIDMPFAVVSFVTFAILTVICGALTFNIIDSLGNSDNEYAQFAYNETQGLKEKTTLWGDFMFVMLFAGLWLIMYVSAFFIRVSPMFLGLGVILLMITIVLSATFSNFFLDFLLGGETLFNNFTDPDVSNNYPLTIFIMQYLPYFNTIMGGLLLIILYAKLRGQDEF